MKKSLDDRGNSLLASAVVSVRERLLGTRQYLVGRIRPYYMGFRTCRFKSKSVIMSDRFEYFISPYFIGLKIADPNHLGYDFHPVSERLSGRSKSGLYCMSGFYV